MGREVKTIVTCDDCGKRIEANTSVSRNKLQYFYLGFEACYAPSEYPHIAPASTGETLCEPCLKKRIKIGWEKRLLEALEHGWDVTIIVKHEYDD